MIDVHLNADLGEGLNIERDIMPFYRLVVLHVVVTLVIITL